MASFFSGSRLRRAAVACCLLASAWAACATSIVAQQVTNPFRSPTGPVADGGWDSLPCEADCGVPYGDACCDCCEPSCGCASPCGLNNKYCQGGWFGAEWIYWQLGGSRRLPPLVTASPSTIDLNEAGRLDNPSTFILAGDESVNDGWRSGFRLSTGVWLDCCHNWGIGGDYFNLGNDGYNYLSQPSADLIVARPFYNTELGEDDAELVSVPNELDGTARVRSGDSFQGAGLTVTRCLWSCCDPCTGSESRLAGLGGYRYYNYDSDLTITENLTVLENTTTPLVPGTTFFVQDRFRTRNEFNGGEIGLQGYKQHCWWWVDGTAKMAIGNQRRSVTVSGRTITSVPGDDTTDLPGGLLTSSETNIGTYHDSSVVVIPEFRLGVGTCLTRCWSIHAGYNVILWGDVARAASHLPPGLAVDPRNLPPVQSGGGDDPVFPGIRGTQLIAHGLDLSMTWQY